MYFLSPFYKLWILLSDITLYYFETPYHEGHFSVINDAFNIDDDGQFNLGRSL